LSTQVYECLFILDSNRYARDPGGVSTGIKEMIQKGGGEVLASRLWNEQKLAYTMDGHRKGTFWLTYFRMPTANLAGYNRQCQLNENVVRNLTIKIDPRLVDVLVEHALGGTSRKTVLAEPIADVVGIDPDIPDLGNMDDAV